MSERSTFSPFWHRIRSMKPRLRPHVQVTRQHYRGRRWHVVHDPTSNQFYRLNPIAHDYIGMLDGTRDIETAWKMSLGKHGDSAPTQNEIIQLISQLYSANLLSIDATPEMEQLLSRGRDRLKKKIQQQVIGVMYFRIRLLNPDRILAAVEPIVRPLLSRFGLVLWLILVAAAFSQVIPHWDRLVSGVDKVMAPSNWGWLIVVFVVTKLIHESGHGLICKRFGGQVPEFGVMMLVLFPAPYVDASACWAFPSKWKRMAVGAGGMLFELVVASIAAFVWAAQIRQGAGDGLVAQIAYNAMFTASVSTVIFNANPLMRFDGYYMLADLLEVPNLAQRANKMLQYLAQKYLYGLERINPPSNLRGEQATLLVYGVASGIYRVTLFVSITLYVMGKFFAIGAVLAVWTAAAWFLVPTGVFVHWLATSSSLHEKRFRAILTTLGIIAVLVFGVGAIPVPDFRRAMGVVESLERSGVYTGVDGFVDAVHVRPGQAVRKGDPILTLSSPELNAKLDAYTAQLAEFEIDEREARSKNNPTEASVHNERADVIRESIRETTDDISKLIVTAPQDGVIVAGDPEKTLGSFIKKGQLVCEIVDPVRVRIAASLDQRQSDWINRLSDKTDPEVVHVRSVKIHSISYREKLDSAAPQSSDEERELIGSTVRKEPAGQRLLPHAALGYSGGGQVAVDQEHDREGRLSKGERFTVYVDPPSSDPIAVDAPFGSAVGLPGERVKVRFRLDNRPLFHQYIDRLVIRIKEGVKI